MTAPTQDQTFDLDSVFDNAGGGGSGTPSYEWPQQEDPRKKGRFVPIVGGEIKGEITDVFVTFVRDAQTGEAKLNKKNQQMPQVNITIQTDLRNWDGCKSVPLTDPKDPNSPPKDASEDTGERRIYVKYRMLDAVARAIKASPQGKGGPRVGAKLAVKVTDLEYNSNPMYHPLADYQAVYVPPANDPAASVFDQQQPATPAKPANDPWSSATSGEPPF